MRNRRKNIKQWRKVSALEDIPKLGSLVIETEEEMVAVFRTSNDEVFALEDACPHQRGLLSRGVVNETSVTCPVHKWEIDLRSGDALAPNYGCTTSFQTKVEDGIVFIGIVEKHGT